jgi:hypothetical protein
MVTPGEAVLSAELIALSPAISLIVGTVGAIISPEAVPSIVTEMGEEAALVLPA